MAICASFNHNLRRFGAISGTFLMDNFNYNSMRAKEARAGKFLNNILTRAVLWLLALGGFGGAIYLLSFRHSSLGWLALAAALFASMLLAWIRNEIVKVPMGKTQDINDILSANVLRILDRNPTPQSVAPKLMKTRSGRFLAAHFDITPAFLESIAAGLSSDMAPIFAAAREIRSKVDGETVSGGMLAVAMTQNHPEHEEILRRMRLELNDLYTGMIWYDHLHGLVKESRKRRRDGGIARDFSFGYIPLLQKFGRNISVRTKGMASTQVRLVSHREIIDKMVTIFSGQGRQNIALIGPEGCGRSTIVHAFSEKILDADAKIPNSLKYRQVFILDATALLSAAHGPGQIESLVTRVLNEAYAAKNIIICLDNAHLFFEEGTGSVDIANVLLPVLEAGRLRMILMLEEQKYLEIAAKNSSLVNALNKIIVPSADREDTLKILQDRAPLLESKYGVICTYWSLLEAYRLSEKYIHDLVMPGRAINLLESACNYAEDGFVTDQSVQRAVEATQGVKVQSDTSTADREKLLQLEMLIHQRMVDQEPAVKAVADALRRSAAGVRNEKRPIGTFLFLGPTGVGKTELAKALSEVYFNGEEHIVRIDLNEYVAASDVARLIAEGSKNASSLTAQVMKRPFSVVLLDEIEKAHPQVLTTLLQLLDEGILRDESNREVSFRDTIVIATSNAGAGHIREYISQSMDFDSIKDELTNAMISEGQFQPEFLNRFDEICIFKPLSKEDLVQIVDLMIKTVNKTLAPQKISVKLTDDAKLLLVEKGYDPQMGARPMRRVVQKTVENLLAKLMLSGTVDSGATIEITLDMIEAE